LKQSIVESGLALMRHDTHEAHRRTAARAIWRTDRERLGLGLSGWHRFLAQEIAYARTMAPSGRESREKYRPGGSWPAQGLGDGKRCGSSAGGSLDCQSNSRHRNREGAELIRVSGSRVPRHSRHGKPRLRWRRSEDLFRRYGRRAPARSTGTGCGRKRSEALARRADGKALFAGQRERAACCALPSRLWRPCCWLVATRGQQVHRVERVPEARPRHQGRCAERRPPSERRSSSVIRGANTSTLADQSGSAQRRVTLRRVAAG
jgi:hypothetical protein